MNRSVWYDNQPRPLSDDEKQRLTQMFRAKIGEVVSELHRNEELEAKRQERLTREAYESLTENERAEFEHEHGATAMLRRLAAHAQREVDEHWTTAEAKRQDDELTEWAKSQSQGVNSGENYKKIFELAEQGKQRAQERQRAREQRELEAETEGNDLRRIWAGLDAEERGVYDRLMGEQPSQLELIQQFKSENRNPIKDIDDRKTLYRMATEKPHREQWVEPLENIENVESPSMLYKMAERQIEQKGDSHGRE